MASSFSANEETKSQVPGSEQTRNQEPVMINYSFISLFVDKNSSEFLHEEVFG